MRSNRGPACSLPRYSVGRSLPQCCWDVWSRLSRKMTVRHKNGKRNSQGFGNRTNRWTRAAGAPLATSLVRRRGVDSRRRVNSTVIPHLMGCHENACSHILGFAAHRIEFSCRAAQSKTYPETRKLLLKMDYSHLDGNFKKLYEEAIPRKADLVHALYDDEQRVCLNAQVVMKSLADSEMLAAMNEWFEY